MLSEKYSQWLLSKVLVRSKTLLTTHSLLARTILNCWFCWFGSYNDLTSWSLSIRLTDRKLDAKEVFWGHTATCLSTHPHITCFSLTFFHIIPGASIIRYLGVEQDLSVPGLVKGVALQTHVTWNATRTDMILENLLTTAKNPFMNYYKDFQYSISDALHPVSLFCVHVEGASFTSPTQLKSDIFFST